MQTTTEMSAIPSMHDTTKMREADPDIIAQVQRELGMLFNEHKSGPAVVGGAERLAETAPSSRPNTMLEELIYLSDLIRDTAKLADDMHNTMFGGPVTMQSGPMAQLPEKLTAEKPSMSEQVTRLSQETRYNIAKIVKGLAIMRDYVGA